MVIIRKRTKSQEESGKEDQGCMWDGTLATDFIYSFIQKRKFLCIPVEDLLYFTACSESDTIIANLVVLAPQGDTGEDHRQ